MKCVGLSATQTTFSQDGPRSAKGRRRGDVSSSVRMKNRIHIMCKKAQAMVGGRL